MQKLLAGDFREGTRAVSEELKNAGGVPKAADEVLKLALNASSKPLGSGQCGVKRVRVLSGFGAY